MKQCKNVCLATIIVVYAACTNQATNNVTAADLGNEVIAEAMKSENEWVDLFDGISLRGWHGFNKTAGIDNWIVVDSALVCLGAAEYDTGGDIVTDGKYENFELTWDWKIEKDGNSGIMYQVAESKKYVAPWETGPEYQMFDDSKDGRNEAGVSDTIASLQTGSCYSMYKPNKLIKAKPLGEWNSSTIIVNRGHVEHWLNGDKIVEFQIGDEDWNKRIAEGKWKDYPDYGTVTKGRIALQDHGKKAYFKHIRIREL